MAGHINPDSDMCSGDASSASKTERQSNMQCNARMNDAADPYKKSNVVPSSCMERLEDSAHSIGAAIGVYARAHDVG